MYRYDERHLDSVFVGDASTQRRNMWNLFACLFFVLFVFFVVKNTTL